MDAAPRDAPESRHVGRYELLFRIASGGMAEVWAGRVKGEAGFQKLVAVKRMLPQLADDDEFTTMFLDEARVAANITSPHCVSTIDLGRAADGSLYIVMEMVVGVTLARILKWSVQRRQPVPVGVAIELLGQAAHGLHDAHEARTPVGQPLHIVHRDVSPQNVLVGIDGRVRLTDFGVARAVMRMTETVAGRVKGKFAYMAPEQLTAGEVDRRADIFSLGVVGWELMSGQRLFLGEHPAETMDKVRNMPILTPHQIRPDVPDGVSRVIMWALERNRDARCPTARDFEQQLRMQAMRAGIALDKDTVERFVADAGGEPLAKIRENIRLALTDQPAPGLHALDAGELSLTPSHKSEVKVVGRSDTDPTTGAGAFAPIDVDASQPSEVAGPGEVLTRIHPENLTQPAPATRSGFPVWVGVALALVLAAGLGVGAVLVLNRGDDTEPVVTPLPVTSAGMPTNEVSPTTPVNALPTEPATATGVSEATMEATTEATIEGDGETGDEGATGTREGDETARATRPRGGRRTATMRRTTTTTTTATAGTTTATTTTAMSSEPADPSPMERRRATMQNGLVGLDAFDEGLRNH